MNRTGLCIALAVAVVVGLLFGVYPKLDLWLSGLFFDPNRNGFWPRLLPVTAWLRDLSRLTVTLLVAPAVIALFMKILLPRRPMLVPGRAAVLMIVTLALGPGVVVNLIFKEHWNRPRPIDVTEFGGDEHFVAWWDPRGDCPDNCSFVAGEPSGAFWTLGPALLLPPAWRALATAGALAFGAGTGLVRITGGGHFFSDVVFSGVFTFLVTWLTHGILYRWHRTRISDRAVERALEGPASWFDLTRNTRRRRGSPDQAASSRGAVPDVGAAISAGVAGSARKVGTIEATGSSASAQNSLQK